MVTPLVSDTAEPHVRPAPGPSQRAGLPLRQTSLHPGPPRPGMQRDILQTCRSHHHHHYPYYPQCQSAATAAAAAAAHLTVPPNGHDPHGPPPRQQANLPREPRDPLPAQRIHLRDGAAADAVPRALLLRALARALAARRRALGARRAPLAAAPSRASGVGPALPPLGRRAPRPAPRGPRRGADARHGAGG